MPVGTQHPGNKPRFIAPDGNDPRRSGFGQAYLASRRDRCRTEERGSDRDQKHQHAEHSHDRADAASGDHHTCDGIPSPNPWMGRASSRPAGEGLGRLQGTGQSPEIPTLSRARFAIGAVTGR